MFGDKNVHRAVTSVTWIWRVVLACVVFFFLFWIANEAFSFDGDAVHTVTPGTPNPVVGFFHPSARVGNPFKNEGGAMVQRVYEDPVYFEVKSLTEQSRATIHLSFVNATHGVVMAGVKGLDGRYRVYPFVPVRREGGVWHGEAQIPLSDASHEKGRYWFSLSVAGLERGSGEYWDFYGMDVALYSDGIEAAELQSLVHRAIKKIF